MFIKRAKADLEHKKLKEEIVEDLYSRVSDRIYHQCRKEVRGLLLHEGDPHSDNVLRSIRVREILHTTVLDVCNNVIRGAVHEEMRAEWLTDELVEKINKKQLR